MIFIQDIPKNLAEPEREYDSRYVLGDLCVLLGKLGITREIYGSKNLNGFDLDSIPGQLVYSNPGRYSFEYGCPSDLSGMVLLKWKLEEIRIENCSKIEYICSSMGALDMNWLEDFADDCGLPPGSFDAPGSRNQKSGQNNYDHYDSGESDSSDRSDNSDGNADDSDDYEESFNREPSIKIVYPTMEYVENSPDGVDAFGRHLCCFDTWNRPSYPKHLFYRAESVFGQVQPIHAKIITAYSRQDDNQPRWVFFGSHNFTPASWGKYDHTRHNKTITVANFEAGILLPWPAKKVFPHPYKRPLVKYTEKDMPWMQDFFRGEN